MPLVLPKLVHVRERVPGIRVPMSGLDDLGIDECTIFKKDVAQESSISVPILAAHLTPENYTFGCQEPLRKLRGLLSKILHGLTRMYGLRGVNTDKPDSFVLTIDAHYDRVTIYYANHRTRVVDGQHCEVH